MSWADLEWYLALLPVGLWASYIMPLGFHSLVNEMDVMPAFHSWCPGTVTLGMIQRRERQSRSIG